METNLHVIVSPSLDLRILDPAGERWPETFCCRLYIDGPLRFATPVFVASAVLRLNYGKFQQWIYFHEL